MATTTAKVTATKTPAKTAGQIILESRKLPAAQQTAYITSESSKAAGVTPKTETKLTAAAASAKVTTSNTFGGSKTSNPQVYTAAQYLQEQTATNIPQTQTASVPENASPSLGKIAKVAHNFKNDELYVQITYYNDSDTMREVRGYLYTASGERVDKEPDFSYANVKPKSYYTFKLDTAGPSYDINNMGGAYKVVVLLEGGIIVDEAVVYLSTGEVINPQTPQTQTPINPDTSSPISSLPEGDTSSFSNETPAYKEESSGLGGLIGDWKGVVVVAALALAAAYAFKRGK